MKEFLQKKTNQQNPFHKTSKNKVPGIKIIRRYNYENSFYFSVCVLLLRQRNQKQFFFLQQHLDLKKLFEMY